MYFVIGIHIVLRLLLYSATYESWNIQREFGISSEVNTCDRLAQLSRRFVNRINAPCIDNCIVY